MGLKISIPILALALSFLSLIVAGYSAWQTASFNKLKKIFLGSGRDINLEGILEMLQQDIQSNRQNQQILEDSLTRLNFQQKFAIQKVGLVRFNPFSDGGGNFSFSLALLDFSNTGVVITSMYGREQNRIYTKKIEVGNCDTKLTNEEQEAIAIADNIKK